MMKPRRRDWPATLASDFEKFDRENPHVYAAIVRLTRQLQMEGHEKVGLTLIYNVARWQLRMKTTTEGGGFKLNDRYQSFYARKVMAENPELEGMFDLRRAEADAWAQARYGRGSAA